MTDNTETTKTTTNPEIKTSSDKAKKKRLSKSKRLHIRRMKQKARKEDTVYRSEI